MDSPPEEPRISRREFLGKAREGATTAAKIGALLLMPSWLIAACEFTAKHPSTPVVSKERTNVPDLGLKINEAEFLTTAKNGGKFALLPILPKPLIATRNIILFSNS